MIGIAILIGVFAYGRVSKSFGPLAWIVVLIVGVASSLIAAAMLGVLDDPRVVPATALQIAIVGVAYILGAILGRWLDRDKERD